MSEDDVLRLLAEGKIERIEPSPDAAREDIAAARRHLIAAVLIREVDPTLAFTGLYDAIRKAIQAHMRASGYRVVKGPGGHVKTGEYALAALDELGIEEHIDEFDALRTIRNQSEYQAAFVDPEDVDAAALHATAIVDAVAGALGA